MRFFQLRLTRNGKGAGVIALLGGIWIVASNRALYLWGGSSAAKSLASASRDLLFVLLTTIAIYIYTRRWNHKEGERSEASILRLAQLSQQANDIILLFDESGRVIEANDRAVAAYGRPISTLLTVTLAQLRHPGNISLAEWDVVQDQGDIVFETIHQRADGSPFPVEVSSRRIDLDGRRLVQSIVRDISERKESERQIIRLKEVYAALSQTNQSLLRISDRRQLFESICDIAVRCGHFEMAWIGLVDEDSKSVVPLASAGRGTAYVDGLEISTDPASPLSSGPIGRAVISGRGFVDNQFGQSTVGIPWHPRLAEYNFAAAASFPLLLRGKVIGAFSVYSRESGYFTQDLVALLNEMGADISFALERMETEKERRQLEADLSTSNARIQGIIEGSGDVVAAVNMDSVFTLCNQAKRDLSFKVSGIDLCAGMSIDDENRNRLEEVPDLSDSWRRALAGDRLVLKWNFGEGRDQKFYESYFAPLLDQNGRTSGAFHIGRDVSQHKSMEFELRKLSTAVEQSPVTVVITDLSGKIAYVNPAFTVASGYTAEEAFGQNPRLLKGGETAPNEYAAMWECINGGLTWYGQFHNKRKDGSLYWEEAVIAPIRDANGAITQFIAIKQDVTVRREAEENAKFLAFHDPLTKLPNRRLGRNKMETAIQYARQMGRKSALLFLDVDHFKRINDSLGHRVGDHLLQALVTRIKGCIRECDTLSRIGGDEFLIVLSAIEDAHVLVRVVDRILEQASVPFMLDGVELSVTVSIGIAVYPDHGNEFDELQRQADVAMYVAKRSGRNTYRFYDKAMDADAHEYLLILNGLHKALDRREFFLMYQPQVNLLTGKVIGAEALIRWNHPQLGIVAPDRFISVAEDSGLIVEIGRWVLREACRTASEWRKMGLHDFCMAVNLSAVEFKRGGLPQAVAEALAENDLKPSGLELELTESFLIEDGENAISILNQLKDLGVRLSLDDFGTGYSSFTRLRDFKLDTLKIDRSFVRDIATNPEDETIVRSVIELARSFGLRTVAEGVESLECLEILRRAGCDNVQGFIFAKPLGSGAFIAYVTAESPHQRLLLPFETCPVGRTVQ